ncbi:hypothetical protein AYL99_06355 [Fonsecaea erecta]|uniref:Uncharacterized protein n=1 Tax=Fonsecaea erecta TaxID=1367422 RepID=A0A178ZGY4_9EURO|nr:hypothetical protein AYL99_06355 [Fonsecaea erecta]OAP59057.1 hypothetical protein AYL99_06355 [Fonsecaea erecta]
MSSSHGKHDEKAQQPRSNPDKMSIASVLNDHDLVQDQKTGYQASPLDDANSTDDDLECRDYSAFVKYRGSETPSTSSNESTTSGSKRGRRPRLPCKKYELEQAYFIWYHRIDLRENWDNVEQEFHRQFGEARKKAGLQCKFYRVLGEANVEKIREQARSQLRLRGDKFNKYGVVQRTARRFPWMRPEDQLIPPLPCFTKRGGCGQPACEICSGRKRT